MNIYMYLYLNLKSDMLLKWYLNRRQAWLKSYWRQTGIFQWTFPLARDKRLTPQSCYFITRCRMIISTVFLFIRTFRRKFWRKINYSNLIIIRTLKILNIIMFLFTRVTSPSCIIFFHPTILTTNLF